MFVCLLMILWLLHEFQLEDGCTNGYEYVGQRNGRKRKSEGERDSVDEDKEKNTQKYK